MEKVFIEVRGGMIQNIQTTSRDIEINVMDYDNQEQFDGSNDINSGWQYWRSKGGDQIVTDAEIEKSMKVKKIDPELIS